MSLFHKKINEITIDDVRDFVGQKHPENIRLEYKQDFSRKDANLQIAKEISSFANQQGGIILWGISEDKETRCPKEIVGVVKKLKGRERIMSICLDHIFPPVIPEIQECTIDEKSDKQVILVRINLSDTTPPHTINSRTGFYIRRADRCIPAEMTEEEIDLLRNKREKLIQRREWLLNRAYNRVFSKDTHKKIGPSKTFSIFLAIPLYPMHPLLKREGLYLQYENSCPQANISSISLLPTDIIKTAADSIYSGEHQEKNKDGNKFTYRYGEINIWSQISYFENSVHKFREMEGLWIGYELRTLFYFINFLANFYKNIGYWGIVKLIYRVENCRGVKLINDFTGWDPEVLGIFELDKDIDIQREIPVVQLVERSEEVVEDILKEYIWNCDLNIDKVKSIPIKRWIQQVKNSLYGEKICPICGKRKISNIDDMCEECKNKRNVREE